jgi:hypothetical protein
VKLLTHVLGNPAVRFSHYSGSWAPSALPLTWQGDKRIVVYVLRSMMLKDLFPRWRAASTNPRLPWESEIDLADSGRWGGLLALIAMDQSAASSQRPIEFWPICRAVVEDILTLRADPPVGTDPLDLLYLQFEACLVPVQSALNVGDLGATP